MPEVYRSKTEHHHAPDKPVRHGKRKHYGGHTDQDLKHTHNPLASYSYYPDRVSFVGTDTEEDVVLILRRHVYTNIRWIVVALVMIVAPLVVSFFPEFTLMPVSFQVVTFLIWYLVVMAFIFEEFLSWYFNVYIITDERVFDVDFVNLIYREITDANIDQIQDVTTKVGGVTRTMFHYGDVFIQTASTNPQIEFEAVPYPDRVAAVLRDLRVEEEQEKIEGRVR